MPQQRIELYPASCGPADSRQAAEPGIHLSIPAPVLERLLRERHLSACEFKCLDQAAKQEVWRLCLDSCRSCLLLAQHDFRQP